MRDEANNPMILAPSAALLPNTGQVVDAHELALRGQSFLNDKIRRATPADFRFVQHLGDKFSNCVGFIPRAGVEVYCERGEVLIGSENDEPAGYLLGRPHLRWQPLMRPIFQAAVAMDAQRRHLGLALVEQVINDAKIAGQLAVQANCREGLDANEFWKAAGFLPICYLTPTTARKRAVICWRKLLTNKIPLWLASPPPVAGYRAKRVHFKRR